MLQMNNETINELYDISKRLKESYDEKINAKAILSKNPSSSIRERERIAKEEYIKALNDYEYFMKKYVVFKEKEDN